MATRLSKAEFVSYMRSPKFKMKKTQFKQKNKSLRHLCKRGGWRCYCCGESEDVDIFHKTYARLGDENIETDLVPVCAGCVQQIMLLRRERKFTQGGSIAYLKKMFNGWK